MVNIENSLKGGDGVALEQQTGFLLQLAHQSARRVFNKALEPLNIQAKHLGVLAAVAGNRSFSQKQVANHLELDKSSVVLIVDDLERLKLAQRRKYPNDRRAHALQITEKGRRLVNEAAKIAAEVDRKIFAGLSPPGRRRLDEALLRIIRNCEIPREEKLK
jgi:DNA-binding MarR family transcriptional regulator